MLLQQIIKGALNGAQN